MGATNRPRGCCAIPPTPAGVPIPEGTGLQGQPAGAATIDFGAHTDEARIEHDDTFES